MAFKRGLSIKVFLTTENPDGAIAGLETEQDLEATASAGGYGPNAGSSLLGVGELGSVDTGSVALYTASEIRNVESIDPSWGWEDEPFKTFGLTRDMDNPIREKWEVTITRKQEDKLFSKMVEQARFGVTGSSPELFDALGTYPDDTGYRVYLWDGTSYYMGCHGTIAPDSYKLALAPTGVTSETITFRGGTWYAHVLTTSATLTTSVSITQ